MAISDLFTPPGMRRSAVGEPFVPEGYARRLIASNMEILGTQQRLPSVEAAIQAGESPNIAQLVALHRMEYNEKYYAEYQGTSVVPFTLPIGAFKEHGPDAKTLKSFSLTYTSDIISELFTKYLRPAIVKSIRNDLYRDPKITQYNRGAGRSIEVDAKWNKTDNTMQIVVQGPFWLRFFFYGRRAFTIHGKSGGKSHGMLVFYDPQTGRKIVTHEVHMPQIPPGNYVEKAMTKVLNELSNTDHFERIFQKYYRDHWLSTGGYGDIERFQKILVSQLRTVTDKKGRQVYDILNRVGRGRKVTDEIRDALDKVDQEARLNLQSVVKDFSNRADKESRRAKTEVYNALRFLLENSVLRLELSDVRSMLPAELAQKSTAARIFREMRTPV